MSRALREPEELRPLLGVPFTPDQLAAATAPMTPGLVVAGAGSGKTSVMAARVVWLVGTGQVQPDRVLGLTFTNKAAGELSARVALALRQAGLAGEAAGSSEDAGDPVVSTYHAFAGRLVVEHGLRLGIEPRSRLLADATRYQLAARVLRRHRGRIAALTSPLSMLVGDLVALDAELSEHLTDPGALRSWDQAWVEAVERACAAQELLPKTKGLCDRLRAFAAAARKRQELVALVEEYRAAKRDLDALDFGDQVALGALLAETVPEVGAAERLRAGVVLLDEYQDTSVAQRRMLAGLFGAPAAPGYPVTAVGDPCQAIYGWRGASVANLDGFPLHFPQASGAAATVYSLSVNQRSGGRLLELANAVAAPLHARHAVVRLTAPPDKQDVGAVVVALHASWREETAWVAAQVAAAVEGGTAPGKCAVLVRARSDFGDLYAALIAAGLPVEVVGLGGLLALPEVGDVVAVLEVLDDATANAALLRLLTGPRWRLGPRDLAQLGRRARELLREDLSRAAGAAVEEGGAAAGLDTAGLSAAGLSAAGLSAAGLDAVGVHAAMDRSAPDAALRDAVAGVDPCDVVSLADALELPGHAGWSSDGLRRVTALNAELRDLRRFRDEPLLDLVHRVVEVTGLDVELAASPEALAARRRESLSAFLDVAAGFADLDGESSLASFLAFLRAAAEHERGLDTTTPSGSDAVQLLTAHKAKGLEWDVVACPDLTKKVFPTETLRDGWTSTGAVLPGPLRGDADDQPRLLGYEKADLAAYETSCREHLEREERRLAYVAFTRARRLLIGSGHWWGPTQQRPRGPSPFLEELRTHALAGNGVVAQWAGQPEEATNPLLREPVDHVWPVPYDEAPFQRRRAAADRVLADLATLDAGRALAPDTGLAPWEREEVERLDRETGWLLGEERLSRRGIRDVVLPASLSASQVLRLSADPSGLAKDLARPMPRQPVAAARRGTRFHAWVETLFAQRPLLDPDELPGAQDDGRADDGELEQLQAAFLRTAYALRPPYVVEAPFALPLGGRVVRGRIDAVYGPTEGRWEVVDWKTGRETADPLQLAVYRLAWARLVGVEPDDVDASFLYVRTGEVVRPADLLGEAALAALLSGPVEAELLTLL